MNAQSPRDQPQDEKPLDPAVEKVRRKLVRFVAINLGILFAALMAVVAALVYKSMTAPSEPTVVAQPVGAPLAAPLGDAAILIPAGARILSQSLSGDRLSLHVALPDGRGEAILVYGLAEGRVLARLPVRTE